MHIWRARQRVQWWDDSIHLAKVYVSAIVMMRYIKDDKRAHRRSLPNSGRVGPPSSLYTPPPAGSHPRFHRMSFQYIYTIQLVLYTYTNAILGLRFQIMKFQSRVNSLMSPYTTLVPPKVSENELSTNNYTPIHILYVYLTFTTNGLWADYID